MASTGAGTAAARLCWPVNPASIRPLGTGFAALAYLGFRQRRKGQVRVADIPASLRPVHWARKLYDGEDDSHRQQVQARLLAGQPPEVSAQRTGQDATAIRCCSELCYAVEVARPHPDYLAIQVGLPRFRRLSRDYSELLVKVLALTVGAVAIDSVLAFEFPNKLDFRPRRLAGLHPAAVQALAHLLYLEVALGSRLGDLTDKQATRLLKQATSLKEHFPLPTSEATAPDSTGTWTEADADRPEPTEVARRMAA